MNDTTVRFELFTSNHGNLKTKMVSEDEVLSDAIEEALGEWDSVSIKVHGMKPLDRHFGSTDFTKEDVFDDNGFGKTGWHHNTEAEAAEALKYLVEAEGFEPETLNGFIEEWGSDSHSIVNLAHDIENNCYKGAFDSQEDYIRRHCAELDRDGIIDLLGEDNIDWEGVAMECFDYSTNFGEHKSVEVGTKTHVFAY